MSEGSNPSLLYPIVWVFVGCKDIQSHNECRTPCSEDRQQNLAGTDTSDFRKTGVGEGSDPGEFELGLGSHSLSRYCYAPGEIILCRRNTEEWVRWQSPIQMLMITVPDQTFRSVAEEM